MFGGSYLAANVLNCKSLQLESSAKLAVFQVVSAIGLFFSAHEEEKPFGTKTIEWSYVLAIQPSIKADPNDEQNTWSVKIYEYYLCRKTIVKSSYTSPT